MKKNLKVVGDYQYELLSEENFDEIVDMVANVFIQSNPIDLAVGTLLSD